MYDGPNDSGNVVGLGSVEGSIVGSDVGTGVLAREGDNVGFELGIEVKI